MFAYCIGIRKDLLIEGAQFLIKLNCSTGHTEWAWHKLKSWGGAHTPGFYTYIQSIGKRLVNYTLDSRGDSRLLHLYTTTAMATTAKEAIRPKMTKPGIETGLAGSW